MEHDKEDEKKTNVEGKEGKKKQGAEEGRGS